jgi:hypothetical protein
MSVKQEAILPLNEYIDDDFTLKMVLNDAWNPVTVDHRNGDYELGGTKYEWGFQYS